MKARILLSVLLVVSAAVLGASAGQSRRQHPQKRQESALKAMKATDAWTKLEQQMDQYDAHYIDATNQIAQISDNATRQAANKAMRATDDLHDALKKLILCFKDVVKAQEVE